MKTPPRNNIKISIKLLQLDYESVETPPHPGNISKLEENTENRDNQRPGYLSSAAAPGGGVGADFSSFCLKITRRRRNRICIRARASPNQIKGPNI
jgi:hypothetical protein